MPVTKKNYVKEFKPRRGNIITIIQSRHHTLNKDEKKGRRLKAIQTEDKLLVEVCLFLLSKIMTKVI
mgnify:CR=1 FL=1